MSLLLILWYGVEGLRGMPLIHHHIGGGGQAFGIPSSLHVASGGVHNVEKLYGIWGADSDYAERLQIFLLYRKLQQCSVSINANC